LVEIASVFFTVSCFAYGVVDLVAADGGAHASGVGTYQGQFHR
jgi:hypothetical protein